MRKRSTALLAQLFAPLALVIGCAPATAQTALPAIPVSTVNAVPPDVANAYATYHLGPIWFRDGVDNPAVQQLITILRRAPFDGFAEGPQLASEVEAAVAQARATPANAPSASLVGGLGPLRSGAQAAHGQHDLRLSRPETARHTR